MHNLLAKMNLISNLKLITENNAPRWVIFVVDILLSFFSFTLALFILGVLHFEQYTFDSYLFSTITVVSIRWVGYWITKSYAGIVRYTSTQDAVRLFVAIALSTTGILIFDWIYLSIFNHLIINPSVIIIDSFILLVFLS